MGEVQRVRPPRGYFADHAVFGPAGLVLTIALGQVPPRSPYQPGDWVVLHGYRGCPAGPLRWGFRGYVTGGMGPTLLRGVTDDGRMWCEHWGALQRDGARSDSAAVCVCCPNPRLRRHAGEAEQPALFDLAGVAARG